MQKNNIQEDKKVENIKNKPSNNKIIEKSINSNIIKKPVMTEEEYKIMMKKRNQMKSNSRYKPMKFLFGRRMMTQINQNNQTMPIMNPNINNTNVQINNYTTYLTSIETITEEKYQNDGETVIVEPNHSMKQLNYKYKMSQYNKIMIVYIKKINELEDIYNFTYEYFSFIIKIFEKLCKPFILSLSNLFTNNIKPNLLYFQEIINVFNEFSEKMKNILNKPIDDKLNNKKNEPIDNNLTHSECNLIDSVKKLNNIYADNFNKASKNIQNHINDNKLLMKLETIEPKFVEILNKMNLFLNKLIKRRTKFNDKYQKEFLPYFTGIKQKLNDPSFLQYLTFGKDFLFIEHIILSSSNKIYSKISQFLVNMEFLFKESLNIFYDYLELLNDLIKLYYNENKNVLNIASLIPNKSIINFNNLMKSKNIRKSIEEKFSFNKIIENNEDEKVFNDINHLLLNYRDLLTQYSYVKNDDIEDVIKFNLINYQSSESFTQFLMNLIPSKFPFEYKDVVELKMDIKRNSGIIKGWRNSLLIITYQGHILIFDKDGDAMSKNDISSSIQNDKKISRSQIINSIIGEVDSKKEAKNKNEDLYEAIKNNKFITNYWISSFGIARLNSKDDKKLVQIHEDYMGFRQYRPIIIDVIDENNFNNLVNIVSNSKIM